MAHTKKLSIYCKYIYIRKARVVYFFEVLLSPPYPDLRGRLGLPEFATAWVADQIENVYSGFEGISVSRIGVEVALRETQASLGRPEPRNEGDLMDREGQTRTGATFSERVCDAGSCHSSGVEGEGWGGVGGCCNARKDSYWILDDTHTAVGLALDRKERHF